MNASIRRAAGLVALFGFALSLAGCNTMRGVGRDTAVVGEKIEAEADRHIDDEDKKDSSQPSSSLQPDQG